jgi:methionine-rich copper-binding protein CopC
MNWNSTFSIGSCTRVFSLAIIILTSIAGYATVPTITFAPINGATNVSLTGNITISFDTPIRNINDSPITSGSNVESLITFKLTDAAGANVPFSATINGTNDVITINPDSDLDQNQLYYLELDPVEDANDDATIATNITFTAADIATTITFNPADNAVDVSRTNDLTISFNEAIRNLDNSTITNTNVDNLITLKLNNSTGTDVPFDATINTSKDQITINPSSTLLANQVYFLSLAPVEDASDNATGTESITFTTEGPPVITFNPLSNAVNVPVTHDFTISFNEAIRNTNNSIITDTNVDNLITLKLNSSTGTDVSFDATISTDKKTITINPNSNLNPNQVYFLSLDPVEDSNNDQTATASITFTSSFMSITAPGTLSACANSGFNLLGDVLISEQAVDDFLDQNSTGRTIVLGLNQSGFVFQSGQGTATAEAIATGTDISIVSMVVNFTTVTITYNVDATSDRLDRIRISGLRISSDGTQPTANLVRTGGNSNQNGNNGTNGSSLTFGTATSGTPDATPSVTFNTTTYCQGDVINTGPTVDGPNNVNVRWYSDASLSTQINGLNNSVTPNAADLVLLGFVTTTPGTITRYVTQNPGTCKSAGVPVTITVQAKPVADLTITSGSSTLCRNDLNGNTTYQSVTFTASPSGAANYEFRINGTPAQSGASRVFTTTSQNINNGEQVTVIVSIPGNCPSTSAPITMTINSSGPAADFVVANPPGNSQNTITTFSNQSNPINLTGNPGGGVFSGSGIVGSTFFPTGVPLGTYPITYTVTTTGCTSIKTKDFIVYNGTTAFTGLATSYCSGDALFQVGNNKPGFTFLYILPNNFYFSPTILPSGSVVSGNGFDVTFDNESSWFKGFPPQGTSPATVASTWSSGPMSINPNAITNGGLNTVNVNFFGAYYNNTTLNVEFFSQNVVFTANIIQPTASLASQYCLGGGNILNNMVTTTPLAGANLKWFNDSGFGTIGTERTALAGNSTPSLQDLGVSSTASIYTKFVTQTINGCTSIPKRIDINVVDKPADPVAPSPAAICSQGTFTNVAVTATGTVNWYVDLPTNTTNFINLTAPTNVTSVQLGIDPKNLGTTPLTYNRYVTQIVGGCESDPTTVAFTVNEIPAAPTINTPNPTFCQNADITSAPPITVTPGINIKWYTEQNNLITPVNNQFAATSAELGLNSANVGLTRFLVTQTSAAGCESPANLTSVEIQNLTPVSFSVTSGGNLSAICKTGDLIQLAATPPGGNWGGTANPAIAITGPATATLDPANANLLPDQTFILTYTSVGGCSNVATQNVVMLPSVSPSLTIDTACADLFVDITNSSTIAPLNAASTIVSTAWEFGDFDALPANVFPGVAVTDPIPTGSNGGRTKGTYTRPSHQYKAVGTFSVQYRMTTSDGCVINGVQQVPVNPVPNVDFTWSNSCLGGGTQFTSNVSNGVVIPPGNYNWNFNKKNQLAVAIPGTGANPITTYNSIGYDSVRLIVTSAFNCRDTVQKAVFITPFASAIDETTSYSESFNTSNGGWIAGGNNSSWAFGKPGGTVINRDSSSTGNGNAWKTNLSGSYNNNEDSWVLSPCFNFANSKKPVISLDIWSNTPRGLDGAVLQVNTTGNIENSNNWVVVGQVNQGINWYDQNNINSSPGNQSSVDAGWTGNSDNSKYKHWVRSTFALDQLVGRPNAKFRIAFAGNVASGEGFAFDNIFIGERSRVVLIENFTNSSAKAGAVARTQNNYFNNNFNSGEVVKVQYHTSFPGDDPINKENKAIYDSRAAFYGLTTVPAARLDGQYRNGNFSDWGNSFYLDRVLDPAPIEIQSIHTQKDPTTGFIKINTTLKANSRIPKNAYVQTLIVEKDISNSAYLGANGDTEFQYVAKQMLPSPAGYKIGKSLIPGETFNVPEVIWEKQNLFQPGTGTIVVFVQQDTLGQKRVYQAKLVMNPPHPDTITGLSDDSEDSNIKVYPAPVNTELTLHLPEVATQTSQVRLFDQLGKLVYDSYLMNGDQTKTINTSDFAAGIYILQMEWNGKAIRKKVMIAH